MRKLLQTNFNGLNGSLIRPASADDSVRLEEPIPFRTLRVRNGPAKARLRRAGKSKALGTTYSAIARIWLVARAIRNRKPHQRINASTLAADLEVVTKTIHRDLDFLRDRLRHDIFYCPDEFTFKYAAVPILTYL